MAESFLLTDETVEIALRRIACAEIDRAIATIDGSGDDPGATPEGKVHAVRQQCKKLRALIRLVRPAFAGFEAMNALFRDIGRELAGSRDAKVMIDTFDRLAAGGDDLTDAECAALRQRLCRAHHASARKADPLVLCRARLIEARAHAARWTLQAEGWDALSSGLANSYRSARKAMAAMDLHADAEVSHAWRKHVKYHWQHLRLLQPIQPDVLNARVKKVHKLADLLGLRHDIDVFLAAMARSPQRFGKAALRSRLRVAAEVEQARIDKQARRLGKGLFTCKPRDLARDWGDWWEEWRRKADKKRKKKQKRDAAALHHLHHAA